MVSIIALCNTVLKLCCEKGVSLSCNKLQSIIYSIYQQYLTQTGKRLFTESPDLNGKFNTVTDKFRDDKHIKRFARDAEGNVWVIEHGVDKFLDRLIFNTIAILVKPCFQGFVRYKKRLCHSRSL